MNNVIEIKMGGLEIITDETKELKTFVGSCVAICLFDLVSKVAGMAHIMLPKKSDGIQFTGKNDIGKYADEALSYMVDNMIHKGADPKRIKAKMAGGATIFAHESETNLFNVGPKNIAFLKEILEENNIPLVSEDTGENFGRWVRFNLRSGEMLVASNLKKFEKTI
ncbi:putative chemoreceptor glutamine deamidase CheD [Candidatus Nitrosotalea okcheonensis]|uniref:Probable chemoreceptor glutamine deamidase CheD n=1 Tax=Candidatus Nitrosotalea okcheonensis TaxID=1903276 RepID=A0A2H1FDK6_9ARCH|nr:putative chemoreceptor glutamine deamidase CheD [Candidatus Nitrosotalea okcheonensis]